MKRRRSAVSRSTGRGAGARRAQRPRTFLPPPNQACWIESDSYDRTLFARLCDESPSLAEVIETGTSLVPRFGALVEDIFSLCFKHNVVLRDPTAVSPSAAPHRPLLEQLVASPAVEALRQRTVLDEAQAGLGALLLAEEVLAQIRKERLWTRGDLGDLWDLATREDDLREAIERHDHAVSLAEDSGSEEGAPDTPPAEGGERTPRLSPDAAARAADTARAFAHDVDVAEARLRQKSLRLRERGRHGSHEAIRRVEMRAVATAQELGDRGDDTAAWDLGLGAAERHSAGAQLELGKRLVTNPKLRRLAQMVGRMRACAQRLRKRTLERVSQETYAVSRGSALAHLLPQELVALRHPVLRRDFQRRLLEGDLGLYELRGLDDRDRGPMVVCLDGSSSMAGDKELWSKAVALTLLDIARRQRRLFRFLCFSSAEQPLWTLDVNPRTRWEVNTRAIYDLAEYFPGGGTDFATPLDAAVDCLRGARYRRGDIVLITDGECAVAPEWLAAFTAEKTRLGFTVFCVLIDVGASTIETVRAFSDRVTSVRQLTDDAVRDVFVAL
jgi:uncharacterized protein with von Willebrand factor type A (vWA) domain